MTLASSYEGDESTVDLGIRIIGGEPPLQRRWTVLIRYILAIPQLFVLFFVSIAGFVAVVIGWFAALFTGKLPDGIAGFLAYWIRWSTRVDGYLLLLSDEYPPFNGDPQEGEALRIIFPERGELNRLAVLFRFFIAIPAYFILTLITSGWYFLSFAFWIASLILGRLPVPVYKATATLVRYQLRLYSYYSMLTPTYAWGWKGDSPLPSTAPPAPSAPPPIALFDPSSAAPPASADAATGLPAYPSPSTDLPAGQEPTFEDGDFDFHLAGWSVAWIWIWLVLGFFTSRPYLSGFSVHTH